MRKKTLSSILALSMLLSLFVLAPITAHAAAVTGRYICDAEALMGGTIGVLFIYGGNSSSGIATGGALYYGIYDPGSDDWSQQPVSNSGTAVGAKEVALALDSSGRPHVVYVTADDKLAYTYLDGVDWAAEEFIESIAFDGTAGALSSPDIAIDSGGNAHICYIDGKGGYREGRSHGAYERPDLVYAHNISGSFTKAVRSYGDGVQGMYFDRIEAPPKITLTGDGYCIGVKHYHSDLNPVWYEYNLLFDETADPKQLNYTINFISKTSGSDLGFKLYETDSDGSTVYSLFNKRDSLDTLYVFDGITEIPAATKVFSAAAADMTLSGSDIYYAAMNGTSLLFYQNESFVEELTATTEILSAHPRMATIVTGGSQYILYTGSDTDKSLCIASVPTGGGALTEYKVPNKTPVTITGVTVADKKYDGDPVMPGGTLTVTGAELNESDLVYTYSGTGATSYTSTSTSPTDAGAYQLIISVPEDNANYSGASEAIKFTITKKDVTVTGTTAENRVYKPEDKSVTLNTEASILSGVIAVDVSGVTLEKGDVTGTMVDDNAGNGKSVTVTGFTLSGSKADNYTLTPPTNVTVNIAPLQLKAPGASFLPNTTLGGFTLEVSDSQNTAGVASYTVEIYSQSATLKTIEGVEKGVEKHIPLDAIIIAGNSYAPKAKAVADTSGNYSDSDIGISGSQTIAAYAPLVFTHSEDFNIPASQVDKPIAAINVSGGVAGGKAPYVYSTTGLPSWLVIDTGTGEITGTPAAVSVSGSGTVTVTDAQSKQQSITIVYGIVGKGDALSFGGTTPPAEKIYGDPAFDIAGLTYDGGDETVDYSYVSGPGNLSGTTLTITGAGNIVVKATGTTANYETKIQDYTITVARKPITIMPAEKLTKTYGDADPELSYTPTELVGADTLNGAILARAPGNDVGSYPIFIADSAELDNPNYDLTLASGDYNLTITKRALTIGGAIISAKAYDGTTAIELSDVTSVTLDGDLDSLALGTDFELIAASYTDDAYAGTDKAASITVALKNTDKANNYEFAGGAETYAVAAADITAATQIITAVNQTLTVTHMLDLSTIALSNAGTDATLTYSINGGTSDYATLSGSVLTGTAPGTLTININSAAVNVNSAGDMEYSAAAPKQITVTVSAKTNADADISFEAGSITYGQIYTPSPTTTLTGGAWSYQYAGTANDGTTYDSAAAPTKAGSYTVTATFESDTHIGAKTVNLTIAPKNISIDGVTAASREYDGTTDVDIIGGTLNGIVGADAVTPTVPATGTIVDANAGNNKAVTLGTITLAGTDKDNYTLTQPEGITANIAPKVITFTVQAVADQQYTGSQLTPEPTVKDGGVTLAKDIHYTLSYSTNLNAGTGAGSVTVTGIGNYLGSNAEAAFDIMKATYGGPPIQGTKQVISNTVVGDVSYDLSALSFPAGFSNKNFKSVTVANDSEGLLSGASLSGSILTFDVASKVAGTTGELHVVMGSTNYNDHTVVLTVTTVDKTAVTVAGVTVANKTYNATPVVPGGAPTNSGDYNGIYEYWYNGIGSTVYDSATAPTNAGDYRLTVRIPAADQTYTGEQIMDFNISKASLTVKPKNTSIYIGDTLPTPVIAYEGLQGSDTGVAAAQLSSGNLDMEIKASDGVTTLTNSTTRGSYAIVFTGLPVFSATDNYTIATEAGVLTITNRPSGGGGGSTPPAAPKQEAHISDGFGTATVEVKTDTKTGSASAELISAQISVGKDIVVTMPKIDDVTNNILGIPVPSLSNSSGNGSITLNTAVGNITLPSDMLTGMEFATSSKAQVSIGTIKTSDLPSAAQDKVGNRPIVSLHLSIDGKTTAWNNPDASVTVSIPYTPTTVELKNPDGIIAYYIDGSGNLVEMKDAKYDPVTKAVIFTTTHFSYYAVGYKNPVTNAQFSDVLPGTWYYEAVTFIAEKGITTGTGGGKFSPEAALTRGQFIVMLMRAYSIEPDAAPMDNFVDAGNTFYTNYLAAAKRLGISAGIGNNLFAPDKEITRQEMFTLLYNALKALDKLQPGSDTGRTLADFTDDGDVADWAREAMTALINAGTVGGSNGRLDPVGGSTRAQMAQVLYNLLSK